MKGFLIYNFVFPETIGVEILSVQKIDSYRAPANRSTESVSEEECWRERRGVLPEKENFRGRRVSESEPEEEQGE